MYPTNFVLLLQRVVVTNGMAAVVVETDLGEVEDQLTENFKFKQLTGINM